MDLFRFRCNSPLSSSSGRDQFCEGRGEFAAVVGHFGCVLLNNTYWDCSRALAQWIPQWTSC